MEKPFVLLELPAVLEMLAAQAEWAAAHPMEEIGPGDVIDFGG